MFALLAAICAIIAEFEHAGWFSTSNHWVDVTGLTILAIFFLAIHFIPSTPYYPWRR